MNNRELAKKLCRLAREILAKSSIFDRKRIQAVIKKMKNYGWVQENLWKMVKMVDALFQKGARRSGLDFDDFVDVYFDRNVKEHSEKINQDPKKWEDKYHQAYREKDEIRKYREAINRLDDVFERYNQFSEDLIMNTLVKAAHNLGGFKLPMFF